MNRRRSGSASHESPTNASISGVDDGYRVRIPLWRPRASRRTSRRRTIHVRAIEREEVLTLPAPVDAEKVRATFRHGLLELTLPYQDALKPRRIEVETAQPKQ